MKFSQSMPKIRQFVISLVTIFCLALCLGCGGKEPPRQSKRVFIVLVDETESFALYNEKGVIEQMYWTKVIQLVNWIVNSLKPGDEFGLIGIDEHGFDEDDVRVPFELLDEGFLKAKMSKDRVAKTVSELQQRKQKHKNTDILGALYHAAYFASKEPDRHAIIFCFSDMKQEPRWPTEEEARTLDFPYGTEAYFFYVNASGRTNWETIVQVWNSILTRARLQIHTDNLLNFFQKGESEKALKQILTKLAER